MNQIQKTNAQCDTVSTEPQFCQMDLTCRSLRNHAEPVKERKKKTNWAPSMGNKEPQRVFQAL